MARRRLSRGLRGGALLAGLSAMPLGPAPGAPGNDTIACLLDRAANQDALAEEVESGLAELGPEALPDLFDVLAERRYLVPLPEEGDLEQPVGALEEALLLAAIQRLPGAATRAFLEELTLEQPPVGERRAALLVVGAIGRSGDLDLAERLCLPPEGRVRIERPIQDGYRDALEQLLARDPRGYVVVPAGLRQLHGSLVAPTLRALAAGADEDALEALAACLGRVSGADPLVLAEITRIAHGLRKPLRVPVAAELRPYLAASDLGTLVASIRAAGAVEAFEELPRLVELTADGWPAVADAACESLRILAAQDVGSSHRAWSEWQEEQERWWREQAPDDMERARYGAAAEATQAILRMSLHRLYRHDLVPALADALERAEEGVASLAGHALGHLGSPAAAPALVRALEDPRTEVVKAAWRSLQRITGSKAGPDPAEWEAWAR